MDKRYSVSSLKVYCQCKRKHKLTSPYHMNLEPVDQNGNLMLGSAVHEALDLWYSEGKDLRDTFISYVEEEWDDDHEDYYENKELGLNMLSNYNIYTS